MGAKTIAMLPVEAVGSIRLPATEKARSLARTGLEHGQVRPRTLAPVEEPGAGDCAAKPLLYGPGFADTGNTMNLVSTLRTAVCVTRMYGGVGGVGP